MEFLTQSNKRIAGDSEEAAKAIMATDKHVVIIGGGDTGADCLGTVHREGAASVAQLEILSRPPDRRAEACEAVRRAVSAWGQHPAIFAFSVANEIRPDIVRWSGAQAVADFLPEKEIPEVRMTDGHRDEPPEPQCQRNCNAWQVPDIPPRKIGSAQESVAR